MIKISQDNFEEEVLNSPVPVIADFNADWCGPCKMLKPVLEEIESERSDVKFVSINIDDEDLIAEDYEVFSIPCLIAFKGGKEVARSVGLKPKAAIESFIGEI
ncbi:MAG: thioredoxin [Clostridia bacterium]|nr:thioredoxin [Clostridia bacterium]MBP5649010.1 thioredoxin [Clostridia bacterium]